MCVRFLGPSGPSIENFVTIYSLSELSLSRFLTYSLPEEKVADLPKSGQYCSD